MEVLGLDPALVQQQAIVAISITLILFFLASPLVGWLVYRGSRRLLPEQDTFALLAAAVVIFALTFAITLGLCLRFLPTMLPLAGFVISLIIALVVTLVAAIIIHQVVKRGAARIDPQQSTFGVWGEDDRKRPKNLRHR